MYFHQDRGPTAVVQSSEFVVPYRTLLLHVLYRSIASCMDVFSSPLRGIPIQETGRCEYLVSMNYFVSRIVIFLW